MLAKALMRRKLDAAFMRPEENMGDLARTRGAHGPLVFEFFQATIGWHRKPPSHRTRSSTKISIFRPEAATAARHAVLEYLNRAGIDLKPEREVHNVVHAISMITSTRAVMLLPAYTKRYLPESITTRPVKGDVPTLDLVIAYHKANKSPILKLLLSKAGKLAGAAAQA